MERFDRLFILDPDLVSPIGHNYETSVRVAKSGLAHGMTPTIIANTHFDYGPKPHGDEPRIQIIPYFEAQAYAVRTLSNGAVKTPLTYHHSDDYAPWDYQLLRLLELDRIYKFGPRDMFYVHTLSHSVAVAWLNFFRLRDLTDAPTLYGLIYLTPEKMIGQRVEGASLVDILKKLQAEKLLNTKIFFHVETKRLREAYAQHGFDFPVFMGPIPMGLFENRLVRKETVTVAFLGEARWEKGFTLVPGIIEALANRLPPEEFAQVRFTIQTSTNKFNEKDSIRDAKLKLQDLVRTHGTIETYDTLSSEDYEGLVSGADIVLLPYEPKLYHTRGSGVAFESLAAGKALIVSPDIDIGVTFEGEHLYSAQSYGEEAFAEALARCVGDIQSGAFARRKPGQSLRVFGSDRFFTKLLEAQTPRKINPRSVPKRRFCVYVCMAEYVGGLGFVQRAQAEALRKLGYTIIAIGIPWYTQRAEFFDGVKKTLLATHIKRPREFQDMIPLTVRVGDGAADRRFHDVFNYSELHEFFLHSVFTEFYAHVCGTTPLIDQVLAHVNYDLVVTNYSFTVGLAERFTKGGTVPLLVETHDNHSHQNYIRRKLRGESITSEAQEQALVQIDLHHEMATANRADLALHISKSLDDLYHQHVSTLKGLILRPFVVPHQRTHPFPDGVARFDQLVQRNGAGASNLLFEFFENGSTTIDLLFFGTNHPANNISLENFLTDVFIPHLMDRGLKIFIAGNICDHISSLEALQEARVRDAITLLGMVRDVRDFVFAAKVVVLYVDEGTGFPTKVIETLAFGQAFSINERALYELAAPARDYFPVHSGAKDMAEDIITLLSSREAREKRGAAGLRFYETHFSEKTYLSRLRQSLRDHFSLKFAEPKPAAPPRFVHCELLPASLETAHVESFAYPVQYGSAIAFTTASDIADFLTGGWSYPEDTHTWITDAEACLFVQLPAEEGRLAVLTVELALQKALLNQATVTIRVNKTVVYQGKPTQEYNNLSIRVPRDLHIDPRFVRLSIHSDHCVKVEGDPRPLSVNVQSVIFHKGAAQVAVLGEEWKLGSKPLEDGQNAQILFGKEGNCRAYAVENVDLSEEGYSWLTGNRASFEFRVPKGKVYHKIAFDAALIDELIDQGTNAKIQINDHVVFEGQVEYKGQRMLVFDLPDTEEKAYMVEFSADQAFQPSGDSRHLTWRLHRMALLP